MFSIVLRSEKRIEWLSPNVILIVVEGDSEGEEGSGQDDPHPERVRFS